MHPRQANLLNDLSELIEKTSAKKPVGGGTPMLWKYTDPDSNQEFFLPVRLRTIRSPYSGKIFPAKPEKHSVPDVGKELRQEAKEPSAAPGPKMSAPKNKGKGKKRADWEMTLRDPDGDEPVEINVGGPEHVVAVAPPEWEGTVKHMKKHPEIDNPWALAWSMKNKGDTPHKEAAHPVQAALVAQAEEVISKLAAMPLLWKYVDPDGKEFFITERMHTIHSPFTGRAFPAKPERHTPSDVGKELRDEMRAPAAEVVAPMGSPSAVV